VAATAGLEQAKASELTLRLCAHCGRHYEVSTGVRSRCGDRGRAYDRALSKQKRARRARSSLKWQKVRALASQRDGDRCLRCGSTTELQVHHIVSLANGGPEFDLTNLETVCSRCHRERPGGSGCDGWTGATPHS
jgi:5-methylcytosine-specific restriction endonuclease McrA